MLAAGVKTGEHRGVAIPLSLEIPPTFFAGPTAAADGPGRGQAAVAQGMIAGCRLVGADLQCVPGLTTTPEQQIRILQGQISADTALEGAVDQQITGLSQLLLQGKPPSAPCSPPN